MNYFTEQFGPKERILAAVMIAAILRDRSMRRLPVCVPGIPNHESIVAVLIFPVEDLKTSVDHLNRLAEDPEVKKVVNLEAVSIAVQTWLPSPLTI